MNNVGWMHVFSMIFLSGAVSFAVSLGENRLPGMILRETLRRWGKFLGFSIILMLAVQLMSL